MLNPKVESWTRLSDKEYRESKPTNDQNGIDHRIEPWTLIPDTEHWGIKATNN